MFIEEITAVHRFIALVATMLSQSNPISIVTSSLLFGCMNAFSIRLQGFALPAQYTEVTVYCDTCGNVLFKDRS